MTDLEQDAYVYPGKRTAQNGMVLGHGQGMTLRDWFAGQALAGVLGNANIKESPDASIAKAVYRMADAMLEARK